jgi:hypothetical protein
LKYKFKKHITHTGDVPCKNDLCCKSLINQEVNTHIRTHIQVTGRGLWCLTPVSTKFQLYSVGLIMKTE